MQSEKFDLLVSLVPAYLASNIKMPAVQRDPKIWSLEQKQDLIDSLYNDYDIPKIYFRKDDSDPNKWFLVDGQQRLNTIKEFLKGEFALNDTSTTIPPQMRDKKYARLAIRDKSKIVGRSLQCIIITCSDDEEEELFTRLNNGTPLNSAEKRNAIRGQFRDSIRSLTKHRFFKNKVAFKNVRFAYDAVAAQLALLCLAGRPSDAKGRQLKTLYEQKRIYPEKKVTEAKIKKILNLMDKIFTGKEIYMKKYNVISLYVFLSELNENYAISRMSNKDWYNFFDTFEMGRVANSKLSEDDSGYDYNYAQYQISCLNSPDGENSIRTRHDVLLKKFFRKFKDVETKDPKRDFSEQQKYAIFMLNNKTCQGVKGFNCPNSGRTLPYEDCQFDHITEHADGGKTKVENGQVLCSSCHNYKTQQQRSQRRTATRT